MKKEICHVCGKVKKPYTLFIKNDIFSLIDFAQARDDGPICERCDRYFAMTGEKKEPTEEEFNLAMDAAKFANALHRWWEKDKKLVVDEDTEQENKRDWDGTLTIASWYRKEFKKKEDDGDE